ncbi:hypothetical protein [Streptomyces sp. NPDC052107]|uniref:hypothetical protein n=1 Tax=Streptomyces sp. NPDC052107 TaxID=3155632 RepID=UPI0034317A1D
MAVKAPSPTPVHRRAIAGTGAVVLLLCLPAAATAAEPGAGEAGCPVTASAQGVQVMVSASDNALLQAPSGAGVPVAQACVDYDLGESSGFASNPYPGETIVSAPALVGSQTGQKIPGYPAYAASSYPSAQKAEGGQQGDTLTSQSDKNSTHAQARTQLGQQGAASAETTALANAAVDPARRTSTASATADTQPITLNGVLRLGRVRSVATATVGKDGRLVRDSQLTVGRTEVAGQVVEITKDGVRAAGRQYPLPQADPAKALEAKGVRVRYLRAERTKQGVVSAAVEVQVRQQDTQSGAVYTVTYTFGRAFAGAAAVEQPPGGGGNLPPVGAPPPGAGGGGGRDAGAPAAPPDQAPAQQSPSDQPSAPSDGAVAAPDSPSPVGLIGNPVDMGMTGLYLVVAFGGAATFAFGTLLRLLGVRTRWTS